jgi:protein-S-isoprenylcysteine O-methyltransferase Ste14
MDASTKGPHAGTLVRRPRLGACMAAIVRPELYKNFAIHVFVMFPAAVVMCLIASKIDRVLGLTPLLPATTARAAGICAIAMGGLWVWYVYGYLYLSGGGSPGTHVDGGPTHLVDTGPYTMVRHPSVQGKLLGVIGLGVVFQSFTFLVGFVPILVVYSLVTNRFLQERYCDQRFHGLYDVYRHRVPMLVPRPSGIRRWLRDEAAVGGETRAFGAPPPGIWNELRWYLVGLAALILGFAGIWGLIGLLAAL